MIMKKVMYCTMLLASMILSQSCSNDETEWNNDFPFNNGVNGGVSSSATSTGTLGDIGTFDIALNTESLTESETIPTDDNDYVENTKFSRSVSIVFNENGASFSGDIDGTGILVNNDGANVVITSTTSDFVAYTVSGSTSDGSLKIYSNKKFKLELAGVSITNSTGPAINIQSGKRVFVVLADGTTNTLTDGSIYTDYVSEEDMKGCFFSEGQLIFSGKGSLTVNSNCTSAKKWDADALQFESVTSSGIRSDDYIVIRPNTNIYVEASAGNGIKGNDALSIYGGVVNVKASGSAAKAISTDGHLLISGGRTTAVVSGSAAYASGEVSGSAGVKTDSTFTITGGELYVKNTGKGGKGISVDMTTSFQGGTVAVITTGTTYSYGSDDSKAKGIKADGNLEISGGSIKVRTLGGEGCEGIESKGKITITDGATQVYAYDDALNSKYDLYINGGLVYAQSQNNDAIDANQNLYINGGTTIALGAGTPENPLDAAEGYNIYINGGNVFGIGGSIAQTSSASKQASIAFTASLSGKNIGLLDASGNSMLYMQVPSTNLTAVFMTASGMTAGQAYTVKSDVSISGGSTWNGINATGTISGGTTLTTATAALQVGQGMGGGMGGGGGMPGGAPGGRW